MNQTTQTSDRSDQPDKDHKLVRGLDPLAEDSEVLTSLRQTFETMHSFTPHEAGQTCEEVEVALQDARVISEARRLLEVQLRKRGPLSFVELQNLTGFHHDFLAVFFGRNLPAGYRQYEDLSVVSSRHGPPLIVENEDGTYSVNDRDTASSLLLPCLEKLEKNTWRAVPILAQAARIIEEQGITFGSENLIGPGEENQGVVILPPSRVLNADEPVSLDRRLDPIQSICTLVEQAADFVGDFTEFSRLLRGLTRSRYSLAHSIIEELQSGLEEVLGPVLDVRGFKCEPKSDRRDKVYAGLCFARRSVLESERLLKDLFRSVKSKAEAGLNTIGTLIDPALPNAGQIEEEQANFRGNPRDVDDCVRYLESYLRVPRLVAGEVRRLHESGEPEISQVISRLQFPGVTPEVAAVCREFLEGKYCGSREQQLEALCTLFKLRDEGRLGHEQFVERNGYTWASREALAYNHTRGIARIENKIVSAKDIQTVVALFNLPAAQLVFAHPISMISQLDNCADPDVLYYHAFALSMEDSALEQQTSERFLEICGEDLAHGQVTRNWGGYICSESSWGKDLRMIGGVADEDWQALRGAIHKVAFLRAWQAGRATSWVRRTEDLSGYLGEEKYHAFEKMGTVTEREDYVNMNIPLIASRSRHLAKLRFHDLSDWEDLI